MPRRNLHCLLLITLFSLVCYQKVPGSRYSRVLADAMDRVSRHFYQPVDELNLFEGAMSGMIQRLGDANSKYIKAAKKQEFEEDLNQEFVGIGIRPAIDPQTKQLLVLSPCPAAPPSQRASAPATASSRSMAKARRVCRWSDAVERIRGKPGTSVTLTIEHPGAAQPIDLSIVRQVIHEDTVQGDSRGADGQWNFLLPGDRQIGYIRISGFSEAEQGEKGTAADFRAALEQLRKAKIRGLVLDLRDNRGGSLEAAVEICDMLIPQGEIVTTRGREGQILRAYSCLGQGPLHRLSDGGARQPRQRQRQRNRGRLPAGPRPRDRRRRAKLRQRHGAGSGRHGPAVRRDEADHRHLLAAQRPEHQSAQGRCEERREERRLGRFAQRRL